MQETTYTNPILDTDFPDPSVIETDDGFFAYATQSAGVKIQVAFSPDLVHWEVRGDALPEKPAWGPDSRFFWAPHVVRVGADYRLYSSIESNEREGMCLALATSPEPMNFRDVGFPLKHGPGYTTIDPCFFVDPKSGAHLLYWGSNHTPIYVQEMTEDGARFAPGTSPHPVLFPSDAPYESLMEGVYVIYHAGLDRYFAFVAGDDTWKRYATVVFESESPFGPFQRIANGGVVLEANAHWELPGQGCVFEDAVGQHWFIYHAVDPNNRWVEGRRHLRRIMCMDRIDFARGYPIIHDGTPSWTPQPGPISQPRGMPALR